ncbi:hypothetical protein PENANT_c002G01089 [Penicillium antarcticum]|uniref:Uncharacterized protein n=1 Tax=Penicillium antarcticum TaxID=416450 RepID=A0A1V6QL10_9EURO|nr:hypothetical protein PENANT_c002G01089 [Penicillium antarcticum]
MDLHNRRGEKLYEWNCGDETWARLKTGHLVDDDDSPGVTGKTATFAGPKSQKDDSLW